MINQHSYGMSFLRVMLALLLLKDFVLYIIYRDLFFDNNGLLTFKTNYISFLGIVVNSYLPLLIIGVIGCLMLLFDCFSFIAGLVLLVVLKTLAMRIYMLLDGADNLYCILLPFLAFYGIFPFSKNRYLVAFRLYLNILLPYCIMFQICILYFSGGYYKVISEAWQSGNALYYILRVDQFRASDLNIWLTNIDFFVKFSTYFTVFFEITFCFFCFFNRTKYYLFAAGMILHLGILFLMRVDNFSLITLCTYPVFFKNIELVNLLNKFPFIYVKKIFS